MHAIHILFLHKFALQSHKNFNYCSYIMKIQHFNKYYGLNSLFNGYFANCNTKNHNAIFLSEQG